MPINYMSENCLSNTAVGFVVALAYDTAEPVEVLILVIFGRLHRCDSAVAFVAVPAFAVAEFLQHPPSLLTTVA